MEIPLKFSVSEIYLEGNEAVISSISPSVISNDELVTVRFSNPNPSDDDWIGAFSPANVSVLESLPIKYGYCYSQVPTYLSTGQGLLTFNFTNIRDDIRFYFFKNGTENAVVVDVSQTKVSFSDLNEPLRNRIVATGDINVLQLLWNSYNSTKPTLKWGLSSGQYDHVALAESFRISSSEMCGAPANSTGWHDLGLQHKANITGLKSLSISSQNLYYIFGDEETNNWSKEFIFLAPPLPGLNHPNRSMNIVLMADLGIGSTSDSASTMVWDQEGTPAVNTTMSVSHLVQQGLIDVLFHGGDISYANGHVASWEFYLDMISPFAGGTLYLTTVGNHESDWPNTPSLQYASQVASGGECGVLATKLLPEPFPAQTNAPWWSYDVGLVHFVGMSTEHNFSIGSPQYQFLESDLAAVDRSITPWIVFNGHRSMYVDSEQCCDTYTLFRGGNCTQCLSGTDVDTMNALQTNIEPLLHTYKVNLAFAGHFHDYERQAAVYQGQVVQHASMEIDEDGYEVAVHDRPNATVWMVVGSAGNGPSYPSRFYNWSETNHTRAFGYAVLSVLNETVLHWKYIQSSDNAILDRMIITQEAWVTSNPSSSSSNSYWPQGYGTGAEFGFLFAVSLGTFLLFYSVYAAVKKLTTIQSNRNKSNAIELV